MEGNRSRGDALAKEVLGITRGTEPRMNAAVAAFAVSSASDAAREAGALERERELDRFLADVGRRALRIAEIAVGDRDEALDIVQDAMIRLAGKYAGRAASEWPPLFYRILQNGVRDWHRRRAVRNRVMTWFGGARDDDELGDPIALAPDPAGRTPEEELASREAMQSLEAGLKLLPLRQREAFMLRTFEGFDVADTAVAMGCSEGSVKTHYFRAVHTLRESLGEHWQ